MKGSVLPFPSFHPPSVHPLSFISLRSWFSIFLHFSPLHVSLGNLHRHSMRHTFLSISLHHQNTHNWSFHRVPPVWAPPQAQAPSILRGSSVESVSWKWTLKRILKNQWVCKLKKTSLTLNPLLLTNPSRENKFKKLLKFLPHNRENACCFLEKCSQTKWTGFFSMRWW